MSDQEEIPTTDVGRFLKIHLCLFAEKRPITLAKDTPESLLENGLLFLWACFFGYFDLHI